MECPDCGGPMWDNRDSKRNPKQPDYKCKDKECGKGVWTKAKGGGNGTSNGNSAAKPNTREKWTWGDLFSAYGHCHDRVRSVLGKDAPHDAVQAGVATMLITAEKLNLAGPETAKKRAAAPKPKPQPPPPPPPPPRDDFGDFPEAFKDEDDDLPF